MRKLFVIMLLSSFALMACESKWVKQAKEFEKKSCGCKDKKCLDEANKQFSDFVKNAKGEKVKKSDKKKIDKAVKKGVKCMANLRLKLLKEKDARETENPL